jgi:hypothetical protein
LLWVSDKAFALGSQDGAATATPVHEVHVASAAPGTAGSGGDRASEEPDITQGEAAMAETCYYKGTKVILLPGRNAHGKWECQFTIPDLRASAADTYEGRSPKEYETEQEAEAAAFECSKKILDSSNQRTTGTGLVG